MTTGLKRDIIDKFYTKKCVVDKCIELLKDNIEIGDNDLCIEPSAGNGSFIEGIKSISNNYKFYDIKPDNIEILEKDYLLLNYKEIVDGYDKVHIIGNPPFGRQSSLAIKFIKKSVEYCNSISFILPKSFRKDSMKKYFPLNFHLLKEYQIPKMSFMMNDKEYDVPCVFQIWIKKDNMREKINKIDEKGYKFVKKNEKPDISFRRVGVYAGKIDRNITDKSIQSHYFIKFDVKMSDLLYKKLSDIKYDCMNDTVGARSISKQELIKVFNSII